MSSDDFDPGISYRGLVRLLGKAEDVKAATEELRAHFVAKFEDPRTWMAIDELLDMAQQEVISSRLAPRASRKREDVLALPPGYRLAKIARFLLTRGAFKRYIAPTIADMQDEYVDAVASDHRWHARWIAVRGHLLVIPGWIYALIAGKLAALLRQGR